MIYDKMEEHKVARNDLKSKVEAKEREKATLMK